MFLTYTCFNSYVHVRIRLYVSLKSDQDSNSDPLGSALISIPGSGSPLRDPDPHWNQCGSTTLLSNTVLQWYKLRGDPFKTSLLQFVLLLAVAYIWTCYWARIFKPLKEPRNRFPAWRAGTTTLFVVPARWRNRFLGSIKVYKYGLWLSVVDQDCTSTNNVQLRRNMMMTKSLKS